LKRFLQIRFSETAFPRIGGVWLCLALLCLAGCAVSRNTSTGAKARTGPGARAFSGHPYERHFEWGKWRVLVREVPGDGSKVSFFSVQVGRWTPQGEELRYKSVFDTDGRIQRTWFGDLHKNGWPDLVVYTSSGEKGAYGMIRILECHEAGFHRAKVPISPPELMEGYRGGDEWNLEKLELVRTFPRYLPGDAEGKPGGGVRTFRFSWEKDHWRLRYRTDPDPAVMASAEAGSAGVSPSPVATPRALAAAIPARTAVPVLTPTLSATPLPAFKPTATPESRVASLPATPLAPVSTPEKSRIPPEVHPPAVYLGEVPTYALGMGDQVHHPGVK
jgi:hypothetical protein